MYMYVQMYAQTAQSTPVFVEIQVVQSVLMVGGRRLKDTLTYRVTDDTALWGNLHRDHKEKSACVTDICFVGTHI